MIYIYIQTYVLVPNGHSINIHTHTYRRDVPNQILTSNPRSLHRRAHQRTARQPNPPRRANDAEAQPECNAEVGIAVGGHVREHLGPALIAELRLAGGICVRHGRRIVCALHPRWVPTSSPDSFPTDSYLPPTNRNIQLNQLGPLVGPQRRSSSCRALRRP